MPRPTRGQHHSPCQDRLHLRIPQHIRPIAPAVNQYQVQDKGKGILADLRHIAHLGEKYSFYLPAGGIALGVQYPAA
ncbi:hypothetical protein MBAV_003102 [Candidatus Magnetobacterium bavaricum]|uniref:Uncharacterized protein n=1 Tax=Candidatus Magnetobacterium bavaricum TaxID=29290 RepID=A0A0F3GS33_9BACT|nr:hypothetical protein MBAV_003102 [Candidatus Magnetobacterium bavaricum]